MKTMSKAPAKSSACCPTRPLLASSGHVTAFKALAHAGRLKVFFHLVRVGRELPANEIQSALRLPAPTLSHHLDSLEKAGLIERRRQDRFIYSCVRRDTVTDLVRLLTACC
jgi:ArsR family transcriptional regulator, arsenate/arsenite/antimonite-responsive transcriptional repressor